MPTRSASSRTRWVGTRLRSSRSGKAIFSATVRVGTRLRVWNTKPTRRRRSTDNRRRLSRERSRPLRRTVPEVGRSNPAAHWSNVDLPEPDRPITTVSVPRRNEVDTPSSAVTWRRRLP